MVCAKSSHSSYSSDAHVSCGVARRGVARGLWRGAECGVALRGKISRSDGVPAGPGTVQLITSAVTRSLYGYYAAGIFLKH